MIFTVVQSVLFMTADMTIVAERHPSLFPADPVILTVQVMRLVPAHIAISYLIMDTTILIMQPLVYFSSSWMIFSKVSILGH